MAGTSAGAKSVWADPYYREWYSNWRKDQNKKKRAKGYRHISRVGVPNGMTKPQATAIRAEAEAKAERLFDRMVEAGVIDPCPKGSPSTDAEMASVALKQAMSFTIDGTIEARTRLAAARTVLDFTKAKPAQKIDAKFSNAEAWLEEVAADVVTHGSKQ